MAVKKADLEMAFPPALWLALYLWVGSCLLDAFYPYFCLLIGDLK